MSVLEPEEMSHDLSISSWLERECKCDAVELASVVSGDDCSGPLLEIVCLLAQDCRSQKCTGCPMYFVSAQRGGSFWKREWTADQWEQLQAISIPNSVQELHSRCFYGCVNLRRVTFGSSSSLERIGVEAFSGQIVSGKCMACRLEEISIPDSVRELCERCFYRCWNLRRVTFGLSSSLELIGAGCIEVTTVREFHVPDGVRVLCDRCFYGCASLCCITFGSSSSLERIGVEAFSGKVIYIATTSCGITDITIPDGVRELCDQCFYCCSSLRRVTFGPLSKLERIGVQAFSGKSDSYGQNRACSIEVINIPDSVRELCDQCFYRCSSLRRVTFGPPSCLVKLGVGCIEATQVIDFHVPDRVRQLCDKCFYGCASLRHVTFGLLSTLDRVGAEAFSVKVDYGGNTNVCGLEDISIPDGVRELCDRCFFKCSNLRSVTFGASPSLERIGVEAFSGQIASGKGKACAIEEINIPDSVRELCNRCFYGCWNLRRVIFSPSSSLERIGIGCIGATLISEFHVPDGVRQLCDRCFYGCESIHRVTFGPSSKLERIGVEAFAAIVDYRGNRKQCPIEEISIPDSVRELCDRCFYGCSNLRRVTFGHSSSLERIGAKAFSGDGSDTNNIRACPIEEITIPDSVRELCDRCFYGCSNLSRVTFGPSSSLEKLGAGWIHGTRVTLTSIPNGVREPEPEP